MTLSTLGKDQLATTGINELDRLLSGGIPRGSAVLILCEGQNAQDASALLGIICLNLLERGETAILLTTDPPNETYPQLYAPEVTSNALRENRLFYIDLFSSSMGVQTSEETNIVVVEKPHDLNHVFYHTSMFRDEKLKGIPAPGLKVSWIYHQLSTTIFTVGDPEKVLRFVWNLRSKIKTLRDVAYTVMNVDMHPKNVVETAKHIFDTVIELKTIEREGTPIKNLRVLKNAGLPCVTDLVPYSVDIRKRRFQLGSEVATSFDELKKMFYMDVSGPLKLPMYDEFARYLVIPTNIILNIIRKAGENNLLDAVKEALEYAGYETGKKLAEIFKKKFNFSGDVNYENCGKLFSASGWGRVNFDKKDDNKIVIRIENSPFVPSLRAFNKPICFVQAGMIRGALEEALDSRFDVVETTCLGLGDKYCEFVATKVEGVESPLKLSELDSLELLLPLVTTSKTRLEEFKEKVIERAKEMHKGERLTFEDLPEKLSGLLRICSYKAKLLETGRNQLTYQITDCHYPDRKPFHEICTTYLEGQLEAVGVKTKITLKETPDKGKCVLKIKHLT
nr:V4R domain-containing protein [Candidatus Freyarchaeota archaeon]